MGSVVAKRAPFNTNRPGRSAIQVQSLPGIRRAGSGRRLYLTGRGSPEKLQSLYNTGREARNICFFGQVFAQLPQALCLLRVARDPDEA